VKLAIEPDRHAEVWKDAELLGDQGHAVGIAAAVHVDRSGGEPGRSLRFIGLPAGDYYLIAVDDIEYTATHDPAVLQKLALKATRVTIPDRDLIDVPLSQYLLSDVIK
jgi:hypothetical protein